MWLKHVLLCGSKLICLSINRHEIRYQGIKCQRCSHMELRSILFQLYVYSLPDIAHMQRMQIKTQEILQNQSFCNCSDIFKLRRFLIIFRYIPQCHCGTCTVFMMKRNFRIDILEILHIHIDILSIGTLVTWKMMAMI